MKFVVASFAPQLSKKIFRSDINALRAWAVMSVVFYHFAVPGFSGGFVGVDVFFVISGFLMTGIIVEGLEKKEFSLVEFYFARLRRIMPGLAALCGVVLIIGWFLLAPDDYVQMAEHVRDALLFSSNNTFRKEAGYFDALSHDKWLLHTWSLSVEWQFYMLLPLLLYLLWSIRKSIRCLFGFLLFLGCLSFIACVFKTETDAAKAFFTLKFRCWEMIFGGVVYFISCLNNSRAKYSIFIFYLGSLLVLLSVVFIDGENIWPGYLALMPVIGASLIVYASRQDVLFNNVFFVQWIGSRSYSIYLWHWPIVVLLAYFQISESVAWVCLGILVSLLLGHISFTYVESPARKGFSFSSAVSSCLIAIAAAMVFLAATYIIKARGLPYRVDDQVIQLANEQRNIAKSARECVFGADRKEGALSCTYGGKSIRAIVLGDSHAAALVTAVQSAINNDSGGVYLWSRAACPFIRGVTARIGQNCEEFVGWVFEHSKSEPANIPVVMIARSSLYAFGANEGVISNKVIKPPIYFDKIYATPEPEFLEELKERSVTTICELASQRKVYMVRPIPEMKVPVPQFMARYKMMRSDQRVSIPLTEYYSRHQFVFALQDEAKKRCGVEILDPLPYLCDKERCYGDLNGRPLYFDDDHLSEFGNKILVPMFAKIFTKG
jgi:peptidoglycan/LPS O-acetylase OafA/YrhL